jgi:hypothetical protein
MKIFLCFIKFISSNKDKKNKGKKLTFIGLGDKPKFIILFFGGQI